MKIITVPVNEDMTQEERNEVEENKFHNYWSNENWNTAYEMNKSGIYCHACKANKFNLQLLGKF